MVKVKSVLFIQPRITNHHLLQVTLNVVCYIYTMGDNLDVSSHAPVLYIWQNIHLIYQRDLLPTNHLGFPREGSSCWDRVYSLFSQKDINWPSPSMLEYKESDFSLQEVSHAICWNRKDKGTSGITRLCDLQTDATDMYFCISLFRSNYSNADLFVLYLKLFTGCGSAGQSILLSFWINFWNFLFFLDRAGCVVVLVFHGFFFFFFFFAFWAVEML